MPTILVTGAAGFIGSALGRYLRVNNLARVIGLDKMTYAASPDALASLQGDPDFTLIEGDIGDESLVVKTLTHYNADGVMHLAAETHVDRSIDSPQDFIETNIVGTFNLLQGTRRYFAALSPEKQKAFRFLQVSTDEVYGTLGERGSFTEETPYAPNSPYASSKAAADHLARAWYKTYNLPVIISNCSNNYGPYQFPEKLIPLCITKALAGDKLPVYGNGLNVRDWLYVEDHAEALWQIFTRGRLGEKYNVGGDAESSNIDLIYALCELLDEALPRSPHLPHKNLITFVADRPGHDERYAMDFTKLNKELGWKPRTTLLHGLRKTVHWYLDNRDWCAEIQKRTYSGERLGQMKTGTRRL